MPQHQGVMEGRAGAVLKTAGDGAFKDKSKIWGLKLINKFKK